MADLAIECVDAGYERHAASPALMFTLRITSTAPVHAIALRAQMRIEPNRRPYDDGEAALLRDVFGDRDRWGDTLTPMQFALTGAMVPGFDGSIDVDVPVPVTYDLEVATGKYLRALAGGVVPIVILFSGSVFGRSDRGLRVEPVPWHLEARYALPVEVWRGLMDTYFPGGGWLRLRSETLDALTRYKASRSVATWDETMASLLASQDAEARP
jgi:hypothetical protein